VKIHKQETPDGTLERVTFKADSGEDEAAFKAAVKAWETANGIVGSWEDFFNQCERMDKNSITVRVL